MGAIDRFLGRWGYARLARYGLILTPEGRVMSTRAAVLDDGLGGRIVGWLDGDLAAMELDHHGSPKPQVKQPIAPPPSLAKLPPAAPRPKPMPAAAAAVAPLAVAKRVEPQAVAAEPQVDEDEWEWEIAMARARAAADQVEVARQDLLGAQAVIASTAKPRKTTRGTAIPADAMRDSEITLVDPMASWPKTEPLGESFATLAEPASPQVLSPLQKTLMVAGAKRASSAERASFSEQQPTERSTVIPVPQLPTVADPRLVRPVTKTRRFARGTGRQEETVRTPVAMDNEDKTSPYIELPPEVKPSGFAHTRRVASKQR